MNFLSFLKTLLSRRHSKIRPCKNPVVRVINNIREIDAADWNRLAAASCVSPFLEHEFLASLEESDCASLETGWQPCHFLLYCDGSPGKNTLPNGKLIGAAAAYIKTHSMGEFVFDQGLAQVSISLNIPYYPKLVATLPFTPSPGYRFLTDPDYDNTDIANHLLTAMQNHCQKENLHSSSLLFVDPAWKLVRPDFYLNWVHQYYVWENRSYTHFDDYLNSFNKNQRRNIRRERASVREQGISVRVFTGDDITPMLMTTMYKYYKHTNAQYGPWAAFFLNRFWFQEIGRIWKHRLLLFAAFHGSKPEPAALSMVVHKDNQLIGRYWGADAYYPNLHFELCYYAPIEYAINNGVNTFDPGMGSVHKARRGFVSREYFTWHQFGSPELAECFAAVLPEINKQEQEYIGDLNNFIPWKAG